MKARGKREAKRNASPLVTTNNFQSSTESAKYQTSIIPLFQSFTVNGVFTRGDAPHFVRRLPLAFIFRAFGAGISLCSRLPLAFIFRAFGAGISLCSRLPLAFIFRAFGAGISLCSRLPLAFIFRAFGAGISLCSRLPWLSYFAPLALAPHFVHACPGLFRAFGWPYWTTNTCSPSTIWLTPVVTTSSPVVTPVLMTIALPTDSPSVTGRSCTNVFPSRCSITITA